MVGRIAVGWVSDRIGDPLAALSGLCLASGGTMALLATISPDSPVQWVAALSLLAGVTVISWNGVFLTGLAEATPDGRIAEITSAGTFVLFGGYVLCPVLMQAVFAATNGYAAGLVLCALAPAFAGGSLMIAAIRHRKSLGKGTS